MPRAKGEPTGTVRVAKRIIEALEEAAKETGQTTRAVAERWLEHGKSAAEVEAMTAMTPKEKLSPVKSKKHKTAPEDRPLWKRQAALNQAKTGGKKRG